MGISLNKLAVLERAWLTLIGITTEVLRARIVLREEIPLYAGWEACAATPPEP